MAAENTKIQITLFLRENCRISAEALDTIHNCRKVEGLIQLHVVDLDIQGSTFGIYISPTIVIETEIFAVGPLNQMKFIDKILSLSS